MWAARDKYNDVWLFNNKPHLENGFWSDLCKDGYDCLLLREELFPSLTFENSPQEIECKTKEGF